MPGLQFPCRLGAPIRPGAECVRFSCFLLCNGRLGGNWSLATGSLRRGVGDARPPRHLGTPGLYFSRSNVREEKTGNRFCPCSRNLGHAGKSVFLASFFRLCHLEYNNRSACVTPGTVLDTLPVLVRVILCTAQWKLRAVIPALQRGMEPQGGEATARGRSGRGTATLRPSTASCAPFHRALGS